MSARVDDIIRQALSLPEDERAEVASVLLESIEPPPDVVVEEAWREEVAMRMASLDAGEARTVPWEESAISFTRGCVPLAVELHAHARLEIEEAFSWYLRRSPRAAEGFLREVERGLALVGESPALWGEF